MKSLLHALGACLLLAGTNGLLAEIPPLPPEQLKSQAALIVIGVVDSIKTEKKSPKSGFVDRYFGLSVTVKSVEKGEATHAGQAIVALGWQTEKRPDGWAGPGGHYSHPGVHHRLSNVKAGATVRLFLHREKNGVYEIVSPNGFEILDADEKPKSETRADVAR